MSPGGYIPTSFALSVELATWWFFNCIKQTIIWFYLPYWRYEIKQTPPPFMNFVFTKSFFLVFFFFKGDSQSTHPTYISGGWLCESASVTRLKKGWMRACRSNACSAQCLNPRNIKRAANLHLAPITVSCPSHRPISSHYRPMWIPGKFLRPNLFNPIVPIWPGSFSVSLIITMNK